MRCHLTTHAKHVEGRQGDIPHCPGAIESGTLHFLCSSEQVARRWISRISRLINRRGSVALSRSHPLPGTASQTPAVREIGPETREGGGSPTLAVHTPAPEARKGCPPVPTTPVTGRVCTECGHQQDNLNAETCEECDSDLPLGPGESGSLTVAPSGSPQLARHSRPGARGGAHSPELMDEYSVGQHVLGAGG